MASRLRWRASWAGPGRAGALREVAGLLEEYRLVTVTGPGGVGKTRLAGEVAGQVADRFADGAWLAELAAVRDPAQVAGVVAAALGPRSCAPGCWRLVMMCGCWRPAGSRWRWPGRPGAGWAR